MLGGVIRGLRLGKIRGIGGHGERRGGEEGRGIVCCQISIIPRLQISTNRDKPTRGGLVGYRTSCGSALVASALSQA